MTIWYSEFKVYYAEETARYLYYCWRGSRVVGCMLNVKSAIWCNILSAKANFPSGNMYGTDELENGRWQVSSQSWLLLYVWWKSTSHGNVHGEIYWYARSRDLKGGFPSVLLARPPDSIGNNEKWCRWSRVCLCQPSIGILVCVLMGAWSRLSTFCKATKMTCAWRIRNPDHIFATGSSHENRNLENLQQKVEWPSKNGVWREGSESTWKRQSHSCMLHKVCANLLNNLNIASLTQVLRWLNYSQIAFPFSSVRVFPPRRGQLHTSLQESRARCRRFFVDTIEIARSISGIQIDLLLRHSYLNT